MGYRSVTGHRFPTVIGNGETFMFDYAWRLIGFEKKIGAYISVLLGYTILKGIGGDPKVSILSYGWTFRHNLARDRKWIPFIGYGLLLNNLREDGLDGSIYGHQTRFEFDLDRIGKKNNRWFIKF